MISHFKTISRDSHLPIQVPLGEAYSFVALKKPSSVPCPKGKVFAALKKPELAQFYIYHDICIGSPRCYSHHGTLIAWLCDIIDTNFI
jgi:hypothetical protein